MLSRLFIKNYALIENLDIDFHAGLNIITGETGAGKSIMMGALGLILGNRAEGRHFYHPDQKCIIEGYFAVEAYSLDGFFAENDLDYAAETVIRREIAPDGKSRAFINDSPVTLSVLKSLGELLIDIHSQHATLQLNTEKFQLLVLDSVAKNHAVLSRYGDAFRQYRESAKALRELKETLAAAHAELDFNRFQFEELDKMNLRDGEQEELEEEQRRLENAEEIKRALLAATFLLEDREDAVSQSLKEAANHLQTIRKYLPADNDLTDRLHSAHIEIGDIAREIARLEQDVSVDEQRLSLVSDRLSGMYTLQRKHHVDSVAGTTDPRGERPRRPLACVGSGRRKEPISVGKRREKAPQNEKGHCRSGGRPRPGGFGRGRHAARPIARGTVGPAVGQVQGQRRGRCPVSVFGQQGTGTPTDPQSGIGRRAVAGHAGRQVAGRTDIRLAHHRF